VLYGTTETRKKHALREIIRRVNALISLGEDVEAKKSKNQD
jgi:hypothetical protein